MKRSISLFLALVMLITMFPISAFAEEECNHNWEFIETKSTDDYFSEYNYPSYDKYKYHNVYCDVKIYKCSKCNEYKYEPGTEHDYEAQSFRSELFNETVEYKCKLCGASASDDDDEGKYKGTSTAQAHDFQLSADGKKLVCQNEQCGMSFNVQELTDGLSCKIGINEETYAPADIIKFTYHDGEVISVDVPNKENLKDLTMFVTSDINNQLFEGRPLSPSWDGTMFFDDFISWSDYQNQNLTKPVPATISGLEDNKEYYMLLLSETAESYSFTVSEALTNSDFKYSIVDDKVNIYKYIGQEKNIVIPNTIDGKPVCAIKKGAFANCDFVESVIFPETLTRVESGAFKNCTSLKSADFENVTYFAQNVFNGCKNLKTFVFPSTMESFDPACTEENVFGLLDSGVETIYVHTGNRDIANIVNRICELKPTIEALPTCSKESCTLINCETGEGRCNKCGAEVEGVFPVKKHRYVPDNKNKPICYGTNEGPGDVTCLDCGEKHSFSLPRGHVIGKEIERVEPTCTKDGYVKYQCGNQYYKNPNSDNKELAYCDEVITKVLPARHNPEIIETVAPTCTKPGYNKCKCKDCGEIYEDHGIVNEKEYEDFKSASPSDLEEFKYQSSDSQCKELTIYFGKDNKVGDYCPVKIYDTKDNLIKEFKRDFSEESVTIQDNGFRIVADYKDEFNIDKIVNTTIAPPATGHDTEFVRIVEPTCTDAKHAERKCKKCGAIVKDYGDIDKKLYSHMEKIDGESGKVYTYDFLSQDETCKALNVYFDKSLSFYGTLELYDTKDHLVETVNYKNGDTEYFTIPDNGFKIKFYPYRYGGSGFAVKKIVNASIAAPALGHDYVEKSSVAPTCTTGGSHTYECSRCKDIKQEAVIKEITVNADEYKDFATTFSSCSTNSTKEYVYEAKNEHCQKIKFTLNNTGMGSNNYFEVYDSNDNVVKTYAGTINDTVEVSGNKVRFVLSTSNDSSLYNNIRISDLTEYVMPDEPLGHNYKKTIINPTCTEPGYEVYTCERCGDTYEKHSNSVVIDKSEYTKLESSHPVYDNTRTYTYTSKNKDCTEITLFFDVRTLANNIKVYDTKDNLVESFTSGDGSAKIIKVKDNGFKISVDYNWGKFGFKINKMIETISPIIKPLGHEYELVRHDQPTCTEYGTKHYKCTRCNSTKQIGRKNLEDKEIDKTEYKDLSNYFNKNIDAYSSIEYTYTAKNKNCTKISLSFRDRYCYGERVFVSFYDKDGNLIKSVTGISDSQNVEIPGNGFKIVVKNVDRFSYSGGINFEKITETFSAEDGIVPLGHDYQKSGHVAPTCTEAGYDKYKCTRCDSSYTEYVGLTTQTVNESEYNDLEDAFRSGNGEIKEYVFTSKNSNVKNLKLYFSNNTSIASSVKICDLDDNLIHEYTTFDSNSIKEITVPGKGFKIVSKAERWGNRLVLQKMEETLVDASDAPLGHDYHRSTIEPTCTKGGGYLYKCSRCEHSYTEENIFSGYEEVDKTEYAHIESPHYTELDGRKYYNFKSKDPNCSEIKIYFNKNTGDVLNSLRTLINSPNDQSQEATFSQDEDGRIVATVPGNGFTLICRFEGDNTEYGFSIDKIEQKITKLVKPATGHQYVKTGSVKATCMAEGYDVYTCEKCGNVLNKTTEESVEEVDKSKYENIVLTKEQYYAQLDLSDTDCKELVLHLSKDSYMSNEDTLAIYDAKQTKILKTIQGNLYEDTITLPGDGFLMSLQSNNPDSQIKIERIEKKTARTLYPKVPHNYQLTNTVPATCTENGYDIMTCDMCKDEKIIKTNERVVEVPKEQYKDVASKTTLDEYWFVSPEANCISLTIHFSEDTVLPEDTSVAVMDAKGYEYKIAADSTITVSGNQFTIYSNLDPSVPDCGYSVDRIEQTITDAIHPALGHDYQLSNTVPATCTENGYDVMTCSRCSDSYERYSVKKDIEVEQTAYANIFSPHYADDEFRDSFEFTAPDENCEEITLHFSDETDFGSNGRLNIYDSQYKKITSLKGKCPGKTVKIPGKHCIIEVHLANKSKVYGFSFDKVTQKVPVPLYPAAHKYRKIKTVEPTCTQDGYDVMTCDVCGDTYNDKHLIDGVNVINKEKYQQVETSHPYNRDDKTYVYKSDDKNCKKIVLYFNEQTKFNKTNSYYETAELSIYDGDDNLIQTLKGECPNAVVEVPGNVAKLDFSPNQYGNLQYGFSIDKIEEYTLVPTNKALGHDFDIRHVGHTCTSNGYDVYTCKRCGLSEEKESTQRGWKNLDKQEFVHMQTSHPFKNDEAGEYVFKSDDENCIELKVTFNQKTKCGVYDHYHSDEKGIKVYDLNGNEISSDIKGNALKDNYSEDAEGATLLVTGNGFKVVVNKYVNNDHFQEYGFSIDEIRANTLIPTDPAAHVPDGDIKYIAPTCEENARNEYTCKYCGKKIVEDLYEKDKKDKKIMEEEVDYTYLPEIIPQLDFTASTLYAQYTDQIPESGMELLKQYNIPKLANKEVLSLDFDFNIGGFSKGLMLWDGYKSYYFNNSGGPSEESAHIRLMDGNFKAFSPYKITKEDWKQRATNIKVKYYDSTHKATGHNYKKGQQEIVDVPEKDLPPAYYNQIVEKFKEATGIDASELGWYASSLDVSHFPSVTASPKVKEDNGNDDNNNDNSAEDGSDENKDENKSDENKDEYDGYKFSFIPYSLIGLDASNIQGTMIGIKLSAVPDGHCFIKYSLLGDEGGYETVDIDGIKKLLNNPDFDGSGDEFGDYFIKDNILYLVTRGAQIQIYSEYALGPEYIDSLCVLSTVNYDDPFSHLKKYNDKNKKFLYYVVSLDIENASRASIVTAYCQDKYGKNTIYLPCGIGDVVIPYEYFYIGETSIIIEGEDGQEYKELVSQANVKNISVVYDNSEPIENVEATCTEDGYTIYQCDKCGVTQKEIHKAEKHVIKNNKIDSISNKSDWTGSAQNLVFKYIEKPTLYYDDIKNDENRFDGEYAITTSATCTESAYSYIKCAKCGEILDQKEKSKPLGHIYINNGVEEATCMHEGKEGPICYRCGEFKEDSIKVLPKTKHKYKTEVLEPTCTEDGYERPICSVCGLTGEKLVIPAAHKYKVKEQVSPTTTTPGYIIYECSKCGHISKVEQPVIENTTPSAPSTPSTPPPPVTEYIEPSEPSISIDSLNLVSKSTNSLQIKWNGNADGYYVYLRKEGSNIYKKIATVTNTSYTCATLNSCTKYDYYVVGYKRVSGKLFYTNKLYGSVITNIKKPSIKSLKTKKRKLRIKYSKVHNATDYQIQISTNPSFKKAKVYSVKKKLPRLKRNKRYYVRIRVYRRIDNNTIYSSWSKIKTIKV